LAKGYGIKCGAIGNIFENTCELGGTLKSIIGNHQEHTRNMVRMPKLPPQKKRNLRMEA
jgi:hypothetical protein